jgi:hypothetical protein
LRVIDPREEEIPDIGLIELEDEETGEQILVDTSDEEFRNSYSELISENNSHFTNQMKKIKIDAISLTTEQDYAISLKKLFKMR